MPVLSFKKRCDYLLSDINYIIKRPRYFTRMEVQNLVQSGNTLQATFKVNNNTNAQPVTLTSTEYIISGAAVFQIKVISVRVFDGHRGYQQELTNIILIRFEKLRRDDHMTYAIKFTSNQLQIININVICNDGTWHLIDDKKQKQQYSFDVTVQMNVLSAPPFAKLHDDTELTDFELRGEDGSVCVHRAVLAVVSPVLRRMLGGAWREAKEGHVDVPGTSKFTLQNLKDYIYLHILPENGLEQLLLLASYYMMPDLEQECIDKLVCSLTAVNACDLLEFAVKHRVTKLMLSILECVKSEAVKINEMRDHFVRSK